MERDHLAAAALRQEEERPACCSNKFYAIRKCISLRAPALFLNWDDCNLYLDLDNDDNKGAAPSPPEYKEFNVMIDAVEYILEYYYNNHNRRQESGPVVKERQREGWEVQQLPTQQLFDRQQQEVTTADATTDEFDDSSPDDDGAMLAEEEKLPPRAKLATKQLETKNLKRKRPSVDDEDERARVENSVTKRTSKRQRSSSGGANIASEKTSASSSCSSRGGGRNWKLFMRNDEWSKTFEDRFALFEKFRKRYFTCEVSSATTEPPLDGDDDTGEFEGLAEWAAQTRSLIKLHRREASPDPDMQDRVDRLLRLGFVVNPKRGRKGSTKTSSCTAAVDVRIWEEEFDGNFELLKRYKGTYGTLVGVTENTARNGGEEFETLARWLKVTTPAFVKLHQSNPSVRSKIQQLCDLGLDLGLSNGHQTRQKQPCCTGEVVGDKNDDQWEVMFSRLVEYKQRHGNCNVPQLPSTALYRWVCKQKKAYSLFREGKQSSLTGDKIIRLTELGLTLQTRTKFTWEERAYQWLEYRTREGKDPLRFSEDGIGAWISKQRGKYLLFREGKPTNLTKEQVDLLTKWGFDWRADSKYKPKRKSNKNKSWEERYQDLVEYKRLHGTVNVPQSYEGLGNFVHSQRIHYRRFLQGKKANMNHDRIAKLEAIGFVFKVASTTTAQQAAAGVNNINNSNRAAVPPPATAAIAAATAYPPKDDNNAVLVAQPPPPFHEIEDDAVAAMHDEQAPPPAIIYGHDPPPAVHKPIANTPTNHYFSPQNDDNNNNLVAHHHDQQPAYDPWEPMW